jgi:hypothetical protein
MRPNSFQTIRELGTANFTHPPALHLTTLHLTRTPENSLGACEAEADKERQKLTGTFYRKVSLGVAVVER